MDTSTLTCLLQNLLSHVRLNGCIQFCLEMTLKIRLGHPFPLLHTKVIHELQSSYPLRPFAAAELNIGEGLSASGGLQLLTDIDDVLSQEALGLDHGRDVRICTA